MDSIRARRSIRFYFNVAGLLLFCVGMILTIVFILADAIKKGTPEAPAEYFLAVVFIAFLIPSISLAYNLIRKAPAIRVNRDLISFNKVSYDWKDLKCIVFTSKQKFTTVFFPNMEGAEITFNDGTVEYILDGMYSNSWKMKLFIQQVVVNKGDFAIPSNVPVTKQEIRQEHFETYAGSLFLSWRNFVVLFLSGIFFFILSLGDPDKIFPVLCFLFTWWLANKWSSYYFNVSEHCIIVRNKLFFRRRVYRLIDIREFVYELNGKRPDSLLLIMRDFKYRRFYASSLRNKNWRQLKEKLESVGSTTRDFYM